MVENFVEKILKNYNLPKDLIDYFLKSTPLKDNIFDDRNCWDEILEELSKILKLNNPIMKRVYIFVYKVYKPYLLKFMDNMVDTKNGYIEIIDILESSGLDRFKIIWDLSLESPYFLKKYGIKALYENYRTELIVKLSNFNISDSLMVYNFLKFNKNFFTPIIKKSLTNYGIIDENFIEIINYIDDQNWRDNYFKIVILNWFKNKNFSNIFLKSIENFLENGIEDKNLFILSNRVEIFEENIVTPIEKILKIDFDKPLLNNRDLMNKIRELGLYIFPIKILDIYISKYPKFTTFLSKMDKFDITPDHVSLFISKEFSKGWKISESDFEIFSKIYPNKAIESFLMMDNSGKIKSLPYLYRVVDNEQLLPILENIAETTLSPILKKEIRYFLQKISPKIYFNNHIFDTDNLGEIFSLTDQYL